MSRAQPFVCCAQRAAHDVMTDGDEDVMERSQRDAGQLGEPGNSSVVRVEPSIDRMSMPEPRGVTVRLRPLTEERVL